MTPWVPEQLRLYRERHTIVPEPDNARGLTYHCEHDGLRLYRIFGGWRHDHDEIRRLAKEVR